MSAPRATLVTAPNVVKPLIIDPATVPMLETIFELVLTYPTPTVAVFCVAVELSEICADSVPVALLDITTAALIDILLITLSIEPARNADPYELTPFTPEPATVATETAPAVVEARFVAADARNVLAAGSP